MNKMKKKRGRKSLGFTIDIELNERGLRKKKRKKNFEQMLVF